MDLNFFQNLVFGVLGPPLATPTRSPYTMVCVRVPRKISLLNPISGLGGKTKRPRLGLFVFLVFFTSEHDVINQGSVGVFPRKLVTRRMATANKTCVSGKKIISIIDCDVCILEYLQPFWRYSTSKNGLTLKSGYGVLQGH